jgi:hypothetical protein
MILRWLRSWRERDDRHLFKAPDVDPVDELIHALNEAQERDVEDERRLYPPVRANRHSSFRRRLPDRRRRHG